MLTLAKAGRLQLHREPTDIGAVIGDVVASFSTALQVRNVTSQVEVEPENGDLEVDRYRMRQVLSNLVSNALNQMQDEAGWRSRRNSSRTWSGSRSPTPDGHPADRLVQASSDS